MEWENLFWKLVASAGGVIATLASLFWKSMRDRLAEKDKQIGEKEKQITDLIASNEKLNTELIDLYKDLITKQDGD